MINLNGQSLTLPEAERLLAQLKGDLSVINAQLGDPSIKARLSKKEYAQWRQKAKYAYAIKIRESQELRVLIKQENETKLAIQTEKSQRERRRKQEIARLEQQIALSDVNIDPDNPDSLLVACWVALKKVTPYLSESDFRLLDVIRERLIRQQGAQT